MQYHSTLGHLESARGSLRLAASAHGPDFDDVSREMCAAVDAIDRARKRLKERKRGGTP